MTTQISLEESQTEAQNDTIEQFEVPIMSSYGNNEKWEELSNNIKMGFKFKEEKNNGELSNIVVTKDNNSIEQINNFIKAMYENGIMYSISKREQKAGKRKSRRNRKSKKGKRSRKARKSRRKSNRRRGRR